MLNALPELYEEMKSDGVMFCFSGPASQNIVESIGQALRKEMELEQIGMTTIQKVFSIFVEQVQNIVNYSTEHKQPQDGQREGLKHGVVIVGRLEDKFYIVCGNKTTREQGRKMFKRIKDLQKMDKNELKALYKKMRRTEPAEDSKGAGLGIIEMFRRASEPPVCRLAPIDNESVFFCIKAIG
ncbi:SiaB family protein kinase [Desulfatibacillum aliphaticivorans]|uniref:SiaB family protein kinase n=1 Tax=Desulfatibacillum aliphaticivorans TaxID=218208 RepID=UPI00041E7BB0|nr:SiaB family protein kinase [Desulfatibacillum aliphaticivorans]